MSGPRGAHGPASAVLQAIVDAATGATAASEGWILAPRGDRLHVLAAAGDRPGQLLGATVPSGEGTAGYVVASGQPLALAPRPDDARATSGVAGMLGLRPASVLCVPCAGDDSVAPWSAYGYTPDGFWKPEISAPGRYMVGPVPATSYLPLSRPDKVTAPGYMQLSGTSFSAPVVSGAAAAGQPRSSRALTAAASAT